MNDQILETVMNIMMVSGQAKGYAIEAINLAKEHKTDEADEKMQAAQDTINQAHNYQTKLLESEANGNIENITLLMVHAQDHLMTSITFLDLAKEFIDVYKKI
ncbi:MULTISPECIES: PTS lactose/cellobiose transporter subunit IIA [Aerococcus]|uniref:PTS lactose/cellobiose transporter subunit IIA n=1 Tax=Aerococcus TaxID=1375 RepID=UPI000DCD311E|nr:PTS lactose/cellobiose transporter subunit IIA [Aerococcus urinae]RAV94304.1 PTS lactose/cellobiose transporter subunit IIA [Aerococcus mictus]MDK6375289.1 PTS lactose/cellobiose transporter subunit IIA [Aerococcus urinae]MDK6420137.1 PTS lactose/cellobiose transporter subunit IIA [Aerococcus urinae]MDK8075630.1 PTS lactose/cellobiose transporter subunit IIA [Aerococcus urinae]MDK8084601.1 PTS lactose/cellobiose transporter subunit IIA [Aerococcus urinae]